MGPADQTPFSSHLSVICKFLHLGKRRRGWGRVARGVGTSQYICLPNCQPGLFWTLWAPSRVICLCSHQDPTFLNRQGSQPRGQATPPWGPLQALTAGDGHRRPHRPMKGLFWPRRENVRLGGAFIKPEALF